MEEEKFNLKNEYDKLKVKHKLPDFESLNKEFELEYIEKKYFILRAVRRRLNEKLMLFSKILEIILFPSGQSPISSHESSFFSDSKKQELFSLYKKFMSIERNSLKLDVTPDETGDVDFIKNLLKEWPSFKKEIEQVVNEMHESWLKEIKEESENKYLG